MNFGIRNFVISLVLGVIWGWAAIAINSMTYFYAYEAGFFHNLLSFSIGGGVLGVVVGGFICLIGERLPFRGRVPRAVFVSISLWVLLMAGGVMLSVTRPERYHVITYQTVQGLFLSVVLGVFFGIFLNFGKR